MRLVSFYLFVITLCSCLMAQVTFSVKIPQRGTKKLETKSFKMKMKMDVFVNGKLAKSIEQNEIKTEKLKETVIKANSSQINKLRVKFLTSKQMKNQQQLIAPTQGKTYTITRNQDSVTIVNKQGEEPSASELALLQKKYSNLDSADKVSFLDGRTVNIGETIEPSSEEAKKLFGDVELEVRKFTLTFRETKRIRSMECAIFDTVMIMEGKPGGITMVMSLAGPMVIIIENSWPVHANFQGTITALAENPANGMKLQGKGTCVIRSKVKYSYPK